MATVKWYRLTVVTALLGYATWLGRYLPVRLLAFTNSSSNTLTNPSPAALQRLLLHHGATEANQRKPSCLFIFLPASYPLHNSTQPWPLSPKHSTPSHAISANTTTLNLTNPQAELQWMMDPDRRAGVHVAECGYLSLE